MWRAMRCYVLVGGQGGWSVSGATAKLHACICSIHPVAPGIELHSAHALPRGLCCPLVGEPPLTPAAPRSPNPMRLLTCFPQGQLFTPASSQDPQGPSWQTWAHVCRPQSRGRLHTRPQRKTPCWLHGSCAAAAPQRQRTSETKAQGGQGPCTQQYVHWHASVSLSVAAGQYARPGTNVIHARLLGSSSRRKCRGLLACRWHEVQTGW